MTDAQHDAMMILLREIRDALRPVTPQPRMSVSEGWKCSRCGAFVFFGQTHECEGLGTGVQRFGSVHR